VIGIVRKELREHARAALLATLGCSLAMAFALWGASPDSAWKSIAGDRFQTVTVVASAASGVAFGLLQMLTEVRPGSWALLIHRPISRTRIFAGKALAGLALHFIALGVPFIAATIWASLPGRVAAPFHPSLALPGLADILAGSGYYFAAILVGVRPARWYASRLVPLAAAAATHLAAGLAPTFSLACVVIALGTAVLGVAAWGTFVGAGALRATPIAGRWTLGASMLVGIMLMGAFATALLSEYLPREPHVYADDGRRETFSLVDDGSIVRVTTHGRGVESVDEVTDLRGVPRPELKEELGGGPWDHVRTHDFTDLTRHAWDSGQRHSLGRYRRPDEVAQYLDQIFDATARWYFVRDRGRYVAFDNVSKREVGSLGPEGFAPVGAVTSARFPPAVESVREQGQNTAFVVAASAVWWIDFGARQATRVPGVDGEEILGFRELYQARHSKPSQLAIWTTGHVSIVERGALRFTAPLEPLDVADIAVGPLLGGTYTGLRRTRLQGRGTRCAANRDTRQRRPTARRCAKLGMAHSPRPRWACRSSRCSTNEVSF
jgi:hypothetical protein